MHIFLTPLFNPVFENVPLHWIAEHLQALNHHTRLIIRVKSFLVSLTL